jgi:threonine dehydrogenase-like Zn-dependent dehydrogenase
MQEGERSMTKTATMRGVVLPGNGTTETREYEIPAPHEGEVLVRMHASGICGSDIGYIYRGYKSYVGVSGPAYRGVIAGHEPAGEIVAVGGGVRSFVVGDRVLLYHIVGCGLCSNCRSGHYISCSSPERSSYGWQRDGGHAEYLLASERTCVVLPEELSYVDGALISCGFGTAHQGLLRIGTSGADDLLVIGLGPVGLAAAMIGRGLGARHIYGVEASPLRRQWATSLGLFDAVLATDESFASRLNDATAGKGCSCVIECSGNTQGRSTAIGGAAEWGRVSLVGEGGRLETEVSDLLLHKQITLYASWVTSLQDMERLTLDLARWQMHPEVIVSDRFGLDHAEEAYALAAGASAGKVVIVPSDDLDARRSLTS